MTLAYNATLFLYNLALIPVIAFSVIFLIFTIINLIVDKKEKPNKHALIELPFISVQIPSFNDPIAERCVKKCMKFDYPKNKYEIIIVDDSTSIETQNILSKYAEKNPGFIKYQHRNNRIGFKPGALKEAMPITKGEIMVIFDADWIPKKDFLKRIIKPFADPEIAIVQSRQGFYNKDTNLITKFAAYALMVYHTIVLPINNRLNCVFFCGTAGAIRKSAFEEVGGWNAESITEDTELSVNLLLKGYKSVYLKMETPSEVPDTFESFIKQQMRWCYGNTRVFFDNAKKILFKKGLTLTQRVMITYTTLSNIIAPIVIAMTFFGFSMWFLGEPALFRFNDVLDLIIKILLTGGFLLMGFVTLFKHKLLKEVPYLIGAVFTVGLVLAAGNAYAFIKAILNQKLHWYCTPKIDNSSALK